MSISNDEAVRIATENYENIYRFCLSRLCDEDDACDVTQNVFLMFQESRENLTDSNIRSWLYSVAARKIKEQYRHRRADSMILSYDDSIGENEETEGKVDFDDYCFISDEEIERTASKLLARLTPDEQELFKMIYREKKRYSEISRIINYSEKTVSVKALRLRRKLMKMADGAFMVFTFLMIKLR